MLFGKNKKSSGIISILALALALTMMIAICLTGCTDADAQAAAEQAAAAAAAAQATANEAKDKANAAATTDNLTAALADYLKKNDAVTTEAVNNAITAALGEYLKKTDAVTTEAVNNAITAALADYAKKTDVTGAGYQTAAQVTGAINTALAAYQKTADALTMAQVNTAIQQAIAGLVTTADMNTAIQTALAEYVKASDLATALAGYYTKAEVDTAIAGVSAGMAAGYITIADWDAATALYNEYNGKATQAEKDAFLTQYIKNSLADAQLDYDELWNQIATPILAATEYTQSAGYAADKKAANIETVADFIDFYYDVADNDASGVAGDVAADYTLKLAAVINCRIRNTDVFGDYNLMSDMQAQAAKSNITDGGDTVYQAVVTAFGAECPTGFETTGRYTVELDGKTYIVNSENVAAIKTAMTSVAQFATDIDGAQNLYGAGIDTINDAGEFQADLTTYKVDADEMNAVNVAVKGFEALLDAVIAQQEAIVAANATVADISIDTVDDEDSIIVLVGSKEFDPSNDTVVGLYAEFERANFIVEDDAATTDPIINENSALIETYVYRIHELYFIKAQNKAFLKMATDFDAFITANSISSASDICLELGRIAVQYQDWCMELEYADMKKDGEPFSFDTMISDMNAALAQKLASGTP